MFLYINEGPLSDERTSLFPEQMTMTVKTLDSSSCSGVNAKTYWSIYFLFTGR